MLDGIVTVGAVDASGDGPLKRVANDYGVSGFPTMKLFKPNKSGTGAAEVVDVGSRDPNEIINIVLQNIQNTIQERATGASNGGGGGSSSGSSSGSDNRSKGGSQNGKSAVKQLTSTNFHEEVYASDQIIAIAFVAPWCGHCKNLMPEWEAAASKLSKSGATLATVDATAEEALASQFRVQGYPTIKLFAGGNKSSPSDAVDYEGGRTTEMIVASILAEVDRSGVPKETPELINQSVLQDTCGGDGENIICVLVALPHILETGAEGRNKFKNIITAASKSVRGLAFEFLWFEGGNHQTKLENELDLTFGFPAVAAYSMEKKVYVVHRGSFSETNIRKFLMGIMAGKMGTYPIRNELVVQEVEPWDGKDGVPMVEEYWDDDDDDFGTENDGEEL